MTRFAPSWCYCSVAEFSAYVAGSVLSMDQAWDETALYLRLLESASRRVEQCVNRIWAPRTDTQSFDLGRGDSREDRLADPFGGRFAGSWDVGPSGNAFGQDEWPDYWPGGLKSGRRVQLGDWLLTPTAVTSYGDTARSTTQTLVQGITHDYLLSPPDGPPYRELVLTESSAAYLGRGQQVLTIAGEFGWPYDLNVLGTLSANITTTTATSITLSAAASPGQTLRIGSESLYVTAGTTSPTVRRGVAGTTAATHSSGDAVSIIGYPSDVIETVEEIARLRYAARGQTSVHVTSDPMVTTVNYPGSEEKALLQRLSWYKSQSPKVYAF